MNGLGALLAAVVLCTSALPAFAQAEPPERKALRVCQDPNNMPFSSTDGTGLENRIADIFGKALGLPVTYYSFPQRMAFIRNTLRFKLPGQDYPCDIVMGVPVGFDQVSVTQPYYRSTYAMVFPAGTGLDGVKSSDDFLRLDKTKLDALRIGVYDRSPASAWLNKHGLVERGVPYQILSADPSQYPGEIIERDLAGGKIDVAIVWGPIAGYFAKRVKSPRMNVVVLKSEPGVQFDYEMAMGVRYGEPEWKRQVESLIQSRQAEIRAVLNEYGVPLLEESSAAQKPKQ
jgi:quinoprotein dehydrogenase-associated probable ABC transporter substrate-binding protein